MPVKITINGDGLSYEKETDLLKAGQIITFLNTETIQQVGYGQYSNTSPKEILLGTSVGQQSPRQALMESGAKTNIEKIVVISDFICKRDRISSFSPKEIQAAFKKAGEALPKNFTRDFSKSIRQGYIMETEDKGIYVLTDLALTAVNNGFNVHNNNNRATKRKRGSKAKIAIMRDEIKQMEVTTNLDDFPGYWEISTKGMRILWILAYADKHNISDGLSSAEISYLSSKLKDQIKVGDFTALSTNNIRKGYMTSPSTGGLSKILKLGEDALKKLK